MTVTNYWKNVICRIVIIVGLILVLTAVFQAQSARADEGPDIKVFLNEKYLEFPHPPVLRENVTLVPFRALFEGMNMTVEWDHPRRTAIGEKEGLTIELPIDEPYAFINGVRTELEQPATLVGDHTMVPLRFVGESTGALVSWHAVKVQNQQSPPLFLPRHLLTQKGKETRRLLKKPLLPPEK